MIFPVLETEKVVQIGDMTRISAVKSFVSKDEDDITKVEIRPEASGDWVDVTGNGAKDWYLDWAYSGASRTAVPSVRITTTEDPAETTTLAGSISVVTVTDDALFSTDQDLIGLEPDILKYVQDGRSSFVNVHRAAQIKILEALDESGIIDSEGLKLTKTAVIDVSEVRGWSRDLTLQLIFESLVNAVDDIFSRKAAHYGSEVHKRKARAVLRLDMNGDGTQEIGEHAPNIQTVELYRR